MINAMTEENSPPEVELQQFRDRLRSLPCIDTDDLFAFTNINNEPGQIMQVDVRYILGGGDPPTWDLTDLGPNYVYDLARAIKSGDFDLERREPPILYEVNGLYGLLSDGMHRVAAVKGLDNAHGTLRAEVGRMATPITEIHAFTPEDLIELESRRQAGLWQGTIQGGETRTSWPPFSAEGHVEKYVGPWVFASDMGLAKSLYELVQKI